MKKYALPFLACIVLATSPLPPSYSGAREKIFNADRGRNIFSCSPAYDPSNDENIIPPLTGWGNYKWKITQANDSAQFYFNQGINMYYAFHIIEARASFAKAIRFDPSCAMAWWGQALAFGPNINDFGYTTPPDALPSAIKAFDLSTKVSAKEKAFINAMRSRYSADSNLSRTQLNVEYAAAMKKVFQLMPEDSDAAALYADALMVLHPWDLYDAKGKPKTWTPEIVTVIEKALALNPQNPGANHYYIHAVEASDNPGRALPSADRLPQLMTDVAHLVHMPSHIYIRTGNYSRGARVNEQAVNGYEKYLKVFSSVRENSPLYIIHNLHMKASCNMMAGNSSKSAVASRETMESIDPSFLSIEGALGHYIQYLHSTPIINMIRFGKWDEIMANRANDSLEYSSILLHFGKGIAYGRSTKTDKAQKELEIMQAMMRDSSLKEPFTPFNSAHAASRIAENILMGVIAEEKKNFEDAIKYFGQAVQLEDALVYNEPRDWLLPARHYLGNALSESKNGGRSCISI